MALPVTERAGAKVIRGSKIAKGRMAKALVFRGAKEKTSGGLHRDALMRNKRGKIVSKRAAAHGKRAFRNIETWLECVMGARAALHVTGFLAINGKTLQGKALYVKARSLRASKTTTGYANGSLAGA